MSHLSIITGANSIINNNYSRHKRGTHHTHHNSTDDYKDDYENEEKDYFHSRMDLRVLNAHPELVKFCKIFIKYEGIVDNSEKCRIKKEIDKLNKTFLEIDKKRIATKEKLEKVGITFSDDCYPPYSSTLFGISPESDIR